MRRRWGWTMIAALLLAATASRAQEDARRPAWVTFRGDALFLVRVGRGGMSAAERADAIEDRLAAATRNLTPGNIVVRIVDHEGATDVYVGQDYIFSITDADADAVGIERRDAAKFVAAVLQPLLERDALARTPAELWRSAAFAGGALLALALFLSLFLPLTRRLAESVQRRSATWAHEIRISAFEILSAQRAGAVVRWTVWAVRFAVALVASAIAIGYAMNQFPWTHGAVRRTVDTVLAALWSAAAGMLGYLPNIVYIAVFVLVARAAIGILRPAFRQIERGAISIGGFYADWARPTFNLVRVAIFLLAAIAIFPHLPGAGSSAFQAISIFVGVIVSLGSSSSVANVIAGIIVTYMRPFVVGDRIRVGEVEGLAVEKNLLVVRVRTDANVEVSIPNATVLAGAIANYSSRARDEGLFVATAISIGYSTPWRQVHALLLASAADTEGVLMQTQPLVLQRALGDYYVCYELHVRVAATEVSEPRRLVQLLTRLNGAIQDRFAQAGVEILSPAWTQLRDGNAAQLPAEPGVPALAPLAFRVASAPEVNRAVAPPVPSARPSGKGTPEPA
jgi:small-conductance mechanosensitive channel